ncbi:hypothetical protein CIP107550_02286 [Corynebacterium diphtheriae]|nr:hypothetical protein CIP107550_02286 [Corynebacterium diphtheriae]
MKHSVCFIPPQPPFFYMRMCGVWCCVRGHTRRGVCSASVCVCVGCVLIKGVYPLFFMPTLRGAVGCLWCSRIRDYVNPWSGLRCGRGGGGVFVITNSRTRIRDHGFVLKVSRHENTPTPHHPCYRITAPVNKRARPVRGSINSSSVLVRCMGRK